MLNGTGGTGYATFDGQPVDLSSILVRYTVLATATSTKPSPSPTSLRGAKRTVGSPQPPFSNTM
jgi:hypothetical protein